MSRLYIIFIFFLTTTVLYSQNELGKYLKFAEQQFKKGDYVYALEYYNKALEIDSNSVVIQWNYAECLRAYKDYRKAEVAYAKVYSKEEGYIYPNSLLYLGLMQKQNGNYDEALETFKKAKKKFSKDKKAYIYLKSKREIESCLWAKSALKDTSFVTIQPLPETINTKNAEFGHTILNNLFIFSSLRPDSINENEEIIATEYKTNIYFSERKDNNQVQSQKLTALLKENLNTGNGAFSLDGKRFYFSLCREDNYNYRCKIMVAKYENEKWSNIDSLGEIINEQGANTTMPCIALIDNVETLIFSSDRKGSIGGMDLWMSQIKNGTQFSNVKPLKNINTIENDITPWWDTIANKLYFSNSWYDGFGGNDVFYSSYNKQFEVPINAGIPINSAANDLYFFKDKDTAYISSNRLGVLFSKNPTCCSDIFQIKPIINKKQEIDSVITSKETLTELCKHLPVTLYFHNDVPNPRSKDSTTKVNYINSYIDYRQMLEQYQKEYSNGLREEKAEEAKEDIESFFIEYVDQGVKDLSLFRDLLFEELQKGTKIRVTVKGFASPLAKTNYNVNLTKRRIGSLVNYLYEYGEGIFKPYIDKNSQNGGYVEFAEIPFGEYTANQLTSDNPNDQKNSVYSKAAAIERKIEIQNVSFIIDSIKPIQLISENQLIDFGLVKTGRILEHEFTIKNNSENEITLGEPRITCDCTILEIPKKKLSPNESMKIKMKFDSSGYEGLTIKSVYLNVIGQDGELRLIMSSEIEK
jgi:tetratricopeptide (TPR) repeat protein